MSWYYKINAGSDTGNIQAGLSAQPVFLNFVKEFPDPNITRLKYSLQSEPTQDKIVLHKNQMI